MDQLDAGDEADVLGADEPELGADEPELGLSDPDLSDPDLSEPFFSEPEDCSDPDDPVEEPDSLATELLEASRLSVR